MNSLLPVISTPKYTTTLVDGKSVSYRPFLVKEEKLLLMVSEDDVSANIKTLIDVIDACTFNKLKIRELPLVDFIFLLINIRSKSVGETAKFQITCPNADCGKMSPVAVDLSTVRINKPEQSLSIQLDDSVGVIMKYPTVALYEKYGDKINDPKNLYDLIVDCIDTVYTKENTLSQKDFKREAMVEFIESMPLKSAEKINEFFKNLPNVKKELHITCPHCSHKIDMVIDTLNYFFV